MQKLVPAALVIFLTVSCSSCKDFDWEARPYIGDSKQERIVNAQGEAIMCDQPVFDTFTCFDQDNIAELIAAIDQLKLSKKAHKKVKQMFIKYFIMDRKGRQKLRSEE